MADERRQLAYVSAFSGVGGIDLGMHRAGHNALAFIESDAFRREILARHWPDVPQFDDIRTFDSRGYEADLLVGGFPCQDLSVAGRRAGLEDGKRSSLFFEFARIADALLSDGGWVLIENVPGLLSSNGGRDFAILLATLAELGFHDLAYRVLDSRHFGVPQRRRRVFILARRARGRRAAQVLLEPESGGGDFEASKGSRTRVAERTVESTISALDSKGGGSDDNDAQGGHLIAGSLTRRYGKGTDSDATDTFVGPDIAAPLTRGSGKRAPGRRQEDDVNIVAHTLRAEGFDASEDGTGRGTPLVAGRELDAFLSATLLTRPDSTPSKEGSTDSEIAPAFVSENQRAEVRETPYARQLTKGGDKAGQGYPAIRDKGTVRRLTPTEAERLQGLPDGWTILQGPSQA